MNNDHLNYGREIEIKHIIRGDIPVTGLAMFQNLDKKTTSQQFEHWAATQHPSVMGPTWTEGPTFNSMAISLWMGAQQSVHLAALWALECVSGWLFALPLKNG